MPEPDISFEALMGDLAREEGARLLRDEAVWRARVPEGFERAARAALRGGAARAAKAAAAAAAVKAAALAVAAATAVGAAAYAASPALREYARGLFAHEELPAERAPGGYAVPPPGEGFEVTRELVSESLVYKWFTSADREVLVEIARRLPEDVPENAESILTGGTVWGRYFEDGDRKIARLWDGGAEIRIVFFNAERGDVLAYAEALVAANAE